METLANLESFVRSAELGSFSAAARLLALTPAAVSRNVAMLERNLGARLFQRSTRKLALTETGERFLQSVGGNLDALRNAVAEVTVARGEPAGTLRISTAPHFGTHYLLPLMPEFAARYPGIGLDWQFDNAQVDLIGAGFDIAIGSGLELSAGVVARKLAPAHMIAVASPAYLKGRGSLSTPDAVAALDGLMLRSPQSGRIRSPAMRTASGEECVLGLQQRFVFNDPNALCRAAELGLGIALVPLSHARLGLEQGSLARVLPQWYADAGTISLYYPHRSLLPAKTRCFIDHVVECFTRDRLAEQLSAL